MTNETPEVLLDHCIDALLEDGDWQKALPEGQGHGDLLGMVAVGRWILQLRKQPPGDGRRRDRVWKRVARQLDLPGRNIVPLFHAPPAALRPG